MLLFLLLATEAQATQATSRPNPHFASPPRPFCVNIEWPMIRVSRRQLARLPASLLSIRKALGRPPGAGRCLGSYRTNRPTGGQGSSLTSVSVANCCTIFLKSSGYRNIDDRHRNPNINTREIIWLGNQLKLVTQTCCANLTIAKNLEEQKHL